MQQEKTMQPFTIPLERRSGLNGFQLKLLALLIMTIDHIYYFGSTLRPMPEMMTLIGRIAAPVFVYFVAQGFAHTHDRRQYFLRLYVGGVLMYLANSMINLYFPLPGGAAVMNGIFTTMAVIVLYLWWIENLRQCLREGKRVRAVGYALAMAALFFSFVPTVLLIGVSPALARVLLALVPSPVYCEGSFVFVLLGIGFYYCRGSKRATAIYYTAFVGAMAGISLLMGSLGDLSSEFFMWLALPLILLYNGTRGRGMKYLFYLYYPAHIYVLALAAGILGRLG